MTGGAGHRRCRRRVGAADRGDLARLRADCVASPIHRFSSVCQAASNRG
jgi:hypothetical protein